jgi:hypothetical protein
VNDVYCIRAEPAPKSNREGGIQLPALLELGHADPGITQPPFEKVGGLIRYHRHAEALGLN